MVCNPAHQEMNDVAIRFRTFRHFQLSLTLATVMATNAAAFLPALEMQQSNVQIESGSHSHHQMWRDRFVNNPRRVSKQQQRGNKRDSVVAAWQQIKTNR
jgi:hypothetical protein